MADPADRMARLRAYANHRNPAWPIDQSPDDTGCPWCHEVDGSVHDLAVELLDEIDRLRAILKDVASEGEPTGEDRCVWCGAYDDHKPDCAWPRVAAFDREEA